MKKKYIDLMEKVLGAYSTEHIIAYTESVEKNGIEEHGFPRLTANIGILIANGRRPELSDLFVRMMSLCCREIPLAKEKNGHRAGNDFSVKEVVFCILELERARVYDKSLTDAWRNELFKIDPYRTYSEIAERPPKRIGNWAAFGAVSEQLRKYAGIGDESDFIENQIESQLFSFDENGMYRDPNEPIVYDLVTRLQLAAALYFGFDGACASALEAELLKSADITLLMQSVTGEIPYGGRSNQFLHNEAFFAALCEFYAAYFKNKGDTARAGRFRRAARLALECVERWLDSTPIRHIKNFYPTETKFGCESYAYFDKYMVTTGSWLYLAYAMHEDGIEESEHAFEGENYVWQTSEHFHKVFMKHGDYTVQIDTNADCHYDASGVGRIHKRGVPSAICLTVPFAKNPNYVIDTENPSPFSITFAVTKNGKRICGYDKGVSYRLSGSKTTDMLTGADFDVSFEGEHLCTMRCILSDIGFDLAVSSRDADCVEILFPAFEYDGKISTEICDSDSEVSVKYKGHVCNYFSALGGIRRLCESFANRNGRYRGYAATGEKSAALKIVLD